MPSRKSKLFPDLKPSNADERFMLEAIKEAEKAIDLGECPIGCVIVKDGKVFVRAHNLRLTRGNSLAHAEVLAVDKACKKLGDWRLEGCDMYVTLEPCTMCAGALIQHGHNHKVEFEGGILEPECSKMMLDFFRNIRKRDAGKKKKYKGELL